MRENHGKNTAIYAYFFFGLPFLSIPLILFISDISEHSIASKADWGNLKSTFESHQKPNKSFSIFYKYSNNYLRINRDKSNLVILLDGSSLPYYKQYPVEESFTLSLKEYRSIIKQVRIKQTVKDILKSHIQ